MSEEPTLKQVAEMEEYLKRHYFMLSSKQMLIAVLIAVATGIAGSAAAYVSFIKTALISQVDTYLEESTMGTQLDQAESLLQKIRTNSEESTRALGAATTTLDELKFVEAQWKSKGVEINGGVITAQGIFLREGVHVLGKDNISVMDLVRVDVNGQSKAVVRIGHDMNPHPTILLLGMDGAVAMDNTIRQDVVASYGEDLVVKEFLRLSGR